MEQSSSEANNKSGSQQISRLLWEPKVLYRGHNSPLLVSILRQMNPVHTFPPYFPKVHSNIMFPCTSRSSERSLSFRFSDQNFVMHFSSPLYVLHAPFIPQWYLVRCTSYEAPHYAVFSSLPPLPPSEVQMFSSAPCSQTPPICVPSLLWQAKFHTHTKK